jgi:hypothetical protein
VSREIYTLQRHNNEYYKKIFPEKELRGHCPNFHINVSVGNLFIPTIDLPILLWTDSENRYIIRSQTHECGNWAENEQFPEKEYINGIVVAVRAELDLLTKCLKFPFRHC